MTEVKQRWEQVTVEYVADMDDDIQKSMAIVSMFCPHCERYHTAIYMYGDPTYGMRYCPHCGVKMEVDEPKGGNK